MNEKKKRTSRSQPVKPFFSKGYKHKFFPSVDTVTPFYIKTRRTKEKFLVCCKKVRRDHVNEKEHFDEMYHCLYFGLTRSLPQSRECICSRCLVHKSWVLTSTEQGPFRAVHQAEQEQGLGCVSTVVTRRCL